MKMNHNLKVGLSALTLLFSVGSTQLFAHGDVQPQAVNTESLKQLGEEWVIENPYVGDESAIKVGASAYNSNCARCHGLEAVSGGIAPDLRELHNSDDDEYYIGKARNGVQRNGVTYMPKFEGILSQEAMWAVRAYLVSISIQTMEEAEAAGKSEEKAEEKPEAAKDDKAETTSENSTGAAAAEKKTADVAEVKTEVKVAEVKAEAPAADDPDDPNNRLAKIKLKGVLEVAVYKEFPPYSYVENGKQKGIDVDIAKELAKRLSVSPAIRMVGADENVGDDLRNNLWKGHYLGGGVADVMLHMPFDREYAEEEDMVSFVSPYQLEKLVFAVDTKKLGKDPTLALFTEQPVGVELDTLSDFYLLRAMNGQIVNNIKHYPNISAAMDALKAGEVPAVMGPGGELQGHLSAETANIEIRALPTPGLMRSSWAMGAAVKARHKRLTKAVDTAMAAMVKDGSIMKIFEQHGVTYRPPAEAPATGS